MQSATTNVQIVDEQTSARQRNGQIQVAVTSFFALFAIVGLALYGLPFYYDFMVREFGWSRTQVTSGNALSKLVVGPLFGFLAGWFIDKFGPRRLMLAGILMGGVALIGLGSMTALWMFYLFYLFNALGYVCAGPLPNQVLLTRWFDKARGRAMGFAYLGIGLGGALVPLLSVWLVQKFGWHNALRILGVLIIVLAFPLAYFVKEAPAPKRLHHEDTHTDSSHWLGIEVKNILSACDRKHVFDRRSWWYKSTSQTFSEPGPAIRSGTSGARGFARSRFQSCWSIADGLACRSLHEEVRDAADLPAGCCFDPVVVFCVDAGSNLSVCNRLWHWTRRRLHDHSAHGRRTFRCQDHGSFDGRDTDGGWSGGSHRADVGWKFARPDGELYGWVSVS